MCATNQSASSSKRKRLRSIRQTLQDDLGKETEQLNAPNQISLWTTQSSNSSATPTSRLIMRREQNWQKYQTVVCFYCWYRKDKDTIQPVGSLVPNFRSTQYSLTSDNRVSLLCNGRRFRTLTGKNLEETEDTQYAKYSLALSVRPHWLCRDWPYGLKALIMDLQYVRQLLEGTS